MNIKNIYIVVYVSNKNKCESKRKGINNTSKPKFNKLP